jgi:succinate dehydrogenase/fumarate reductase flavoprotein subunit
MRVTMRLSQPNFFLPFDRAGIDPFTQRFPVTLRLEGTVRGTGGIRIMDYTCSTSVRGLYAAGDAATRELICGGFTGGGSHNAAWALSSGYWAGQSAAAYSHNLGVQANQRPVQSVGGAGFISGSEKHIHSEDIIKATQAEVFPYNRNYFRNEQTLTASLQKLHSLWDEIRNGQVADNSNIIRTREAAGMVATARWMYSSALERKETRGMHKHLDYPEQDTKQQHHLISGGLDQVWVKATLIQETKAKELVTV